MTDAAIKRRARGATAAKAGGYGAIGVLGVLAPMLFPALQTQMALLWIMIVLAVSWDVTTAADGCR